jgi:hypothetical protein
VWQIERTGPGFLPCGCFDDGLVAWRECREGHFDKKGEESVGGDGD